MSTKKASDDTSVTTSKTVETALTGSTIDGNDVADDVSVLTKNDDASMLGPLNEDSDEEKKGDDSDNDDSDDDNGDDAEKSDEYENAVGEEVDNMSALTANTKATGVTASSSKSTSSKSSMLSKLTPKFLKKAAPNLPKVVSTRRFSVDSAKVFSLFNKKKEDLGEIDPYVPAIKFHERMAKRRENFRTRKEIVADIVENAEHNELKMEDDMKFM